MDLTSGASLEIKDINSTEHPDTEPLRSTPSSQGNATKTKYFSSLPPEILFSILHCAIPPYALLDTTLSAGEKSAWCQTLHLMQSLVLVCRSWYDVGIVFLYENICIRRCPQLESLRQTLTSSPAETLSSLVKSLTIQCHILEYKDLDFRANLEYVIDRCTSLSTFAYNSWSTPPAQTITIRFPAYITHFRLEGCFDYDELILILEQLNSTLLSFHLVIRGNNFELSPKLQSPLHLPSLHSLSLAVLHNQRFGMLDIPRRHWAMPSLQRFTVARYDYSHHVDKERCDPILQNAVMLFLASHGGQLRQLHIGVSGFRFEQESFKQVLKYCPLLERIILHPSTFLCKYWVGSNVFFHPNLRWIDFIHFLCEMEHNDSSELCLSKKNLPALEGVRRFCNLPGELLVNWLDDYPPSGGAETEEFVIDVFQHQLDCHDGLFVWRFERDVCEDFGGGVLSGSFTVWDANSSSDSDYVPTSDDDSSSEDTEGWTTDDEDFSDDQSVL